MTSSVVANESVRFPKAMLTDTAPSGYVPIAVEVDELAAMPILYRTA